MRAVRLVLLVFLLAAFGLQVGTAHAQSCANQNGWYVASLNGDIDPGAANFLATAVSNAETACAGHFVFVLQTNGGDGVSMEQMIGTVSSYQGWGGNFTTLVAPTGAYAFSAGSYIAEASNKIFMVSGTTIGSATPIVSGIPTGEENSTMTKDIGAFTSYMQTLTSNFGRNATATGRMVSNGVSYTNSEALAYHVVDGVLAAGTVSGALSELGVPAGTAVNTPGISSTLVSVFTDPNVSSLLFLVGVSAVLIDLYHPTLILSAVGVAVIAVALLGLGVFGASAAAIILMIVGAAFIFLEVKTQHGVSALAGVIIFAVGFLLVFELPPSPAAAAPSSLPPANFSGIPSTSYALLAVMGAAIVLGSLYLRRIRQGLVGRPRTFDQRRIVGSEGTMESDLKAGGKAVALIGAEEWTVTAAVDIPKGAAVRVKDVKGLELVVERRA